MKLNNWSSVVVMTLYAALAMPVQAHVVYTPVNVNLPTNGYYAIDLNHDGITDFTFQISHAGRGCGLTVQFHNILKIQPSPAGGIVGGSWALALQSGVQIDSHQSFYGGDDLMYDVQTAAPHCPPPHSYGYWVFVQQRYLGLEFQINGQTHYGWAELSTDGRYGNPVHFLYGFAYETIPGKAILTGQTTDSPDDPVVDSGSAESKVPAPPAPVAPPFSNAPQPQAPDAPAKSQIITFDAPGAGTGPGQGTFTSAINPAGAIAGYYIDSNNVYHGFLRGRDGTITTFDAPGAGTGSGQGTGAYPQPGIINPAGAITEVYVDASFGQHGFLRAPDGIFTTFDPPGSTGNTWIGGLNPAEAITGFYFDSGSVVHGFLRARDGTITSFDAPGAGTGSDQGTVGGGINPEGTIVGNYVDAGYVYHGFLRARDGTFTTFDAPGVAGAGTIAAGINPAGAITGTYQGASGVYHGFLRARDGTITSFDAPGAGTGSGQGTFGFGLNQAGTITGEYQDAGGAYHGFLRARDGTITSFDAPGAGTGSGQGTNAYSINPAGAITGYVVDASYVAHGFLSN